ncbi:uncharacterized protein LTHEOB_11354 [Lasiodiplodia theobromae]|uniref:uncharacterized protein n=1 Tax=Lasiodiplodia theobromae TaxID=45133 RepID=UPI0015C3CF3E|nr:uncharacterized protein LTHEOB_11354 [Lasiodiplodia theobromae]KAF4537870.1 hypothetical protein LTHEOB_11354 [Lasiodiplodia theobromae]
MAANPDAQLPRQPNWDNMLTHWDGLRTELSSLPNMPDLNEGAMILQAITDMRNDMNHRLTDMRNDIADIRNDMNRRFDRLEQKQATLEKNNQARLANAATPMKQDEDLAPLYSVHTHELIENFPRNLTAINRLNVQQVNALLLDLDVTPAGTLAQKKLLFERTIGVFTAHRQ